MLLLLVRGIYLYLFIFIYIRFSLGVLRYHSQLICVLLNIAENFSLFFIISLLYYNYYVIIIL